MIIRAAAPIDRGALQNFPATYVQRPPRAHQAGYPGWWEKDAEAVIRSLRPNLAPHRRALVGRERSVLVVVPDVQLVAEGLARIRVFGVHRDHHGSGYGGAMLDHVIAHPDVSGTVVQTDVFTENTASRALLASRGFVELPADDDGWITALRG